MILDETHRLRIGNDPEGLPSRIGSKSVSHEKSRAHVFGLHKTGTEELLALRLTWVTERDPK